MVENNNDSQIEEGQDHNLDEAQIENLQSEKASQIAQRPASNRSVTPDVPSLHLGTNLPETIKEPEETIEDGTAATGTDEYHADDERSLGKVNDGKHPSDDKENLSEPLTGDQQQETVEDLLSRYGEALGETQFDHSFARSVRNDRRVDDASSEVDPGVAEGESVVNVAVPEENTGGNEEAESPTREGGAEKDGGGDDQSKPSDDTGDVPLYSPTAVGDSGVTSEHAELRFDVLANDASPNTLQHLGLDSATLVSGGGSVSIEDGILVYNPGTAYDHLAIGEQAVVNVAYQMSDATGLSDDDIVTITVTGANDQPTLSSPLVDQVAAEDASFQFTLPNGSFNEVDASDVLTYSTTLADGSPLPGWLTFDPQSQTFSGTPTNGDVGNLDVRVVVTDGSGATASDSFRLTVNNTNDVPTAITLTGGSVDENASSGTVVATLSTVDADAGDTFS